MNMLTQILEIASFHQNCITKWKQEGVTLCQENFLRLAEENHAFNFQLWHAEDRARRDDLGHEWVYQAKREIDHCNQQRNNRMEAMDAWLFTQLQPAAHTHCPVHSETPGMMVDRLSILALKHYHMSLQTVRQDVDENHRQTCLTKCNTLAEQQKQLVSCLGEFLHEITSHKRTFRLYHQYKMYNDPALNPQLYELGN